MKNNIEQRFLKGNVQKREFTVEMRADKKTRTLTGYAAVFNSDSEDLGGFIERMAPGCFDGRLQDDVRVLFNHDNNYVLGRTTSGTAKLELDEKGLKYTCQLPDTSYARDLIELMERGDITQSSFAFTIEDEDWEERDGMYFRTVKRVGQLYDVSAVTYPAYKEASSALKNSAPVDKAQKREEEPPANTGKEKKQEEAPAESFTMDAATAAARLKLMNLN
jgi:HK97 family phage prohead protease